MRILNKLLKQPAFAEFIINRITNSSRPRPYPFSLWTPRHENESEEVYLASTSDYTSWVGLFNKKYTKRHLPPVSKNFVESLPPVKNVEDIFKRPERGDSSVPSGGQLSETTSMLFPFFAQWFTDSFLRTDRPDWHKNSSNHQIDLCQIYGLNEDVTDILRSGEGGRLKSQIINGEEYLPYLCTKNEKGDIIIKEEFQGIPSMESLVNDVFPRFCDNAGLNNHEKEERQLKFFASGLNRANSSLGYTLMNTIFLRAHNQVCNELSKNYGQWDDDRIFHTARNVMIVILMKIVVIDYIKHISGGAVQAMPRIGFAEKQKWYRENWMAIEFALLYRWHFLIRDEIYVDKKKESLLDYRGFMYNPSLFTINGVGCIAAALSQQASGKPVLFNTPDFLFYVKGMSLDISRHARLQSFNAYRKAFGLKPVLSYEDLNATDDVKKALKELYGNDIKKLELLPGLWAEQASSGFLGKLFGLKKGMFGETLNRMVAVDAFSQALTNPLLSENIYNPETFSHKGLNIIESINSLKDLINMVSPETEKEYISFGLQ